MSFRVYSLIKLYWAPWVSYLAHADPQDRGLPDPGFGLRALVISSRQRFAASASMWGIAGLTFKGGYKGSVRVCKIVRASGLG